MVQKKSLNRRLASGNKQPKILFSYQLITKCAVINAYVFPKGPVLLEQRNSHDELPLDYVESDTVKEELLNLVYPGESIENFYKCREQDFCNQKKELCLISFTKMLLNFCSVYNLSTPLTVTLRAVACSDVLPVMVCNSSKMKYAFSGDWLVDTYFKELETFEKLPQFFQEISGNLLFFPGEHAKALLAVLETMVEPCQVPKCFQKLNSKQATLAESWVLLHSACLRGLDACDLRNVLYHLHSVKLWIFCLGSIFFYTLFMLYFFLVFKVSVPKLKPSS